MAIITSERVGKALDLLKEGGWQTLRDFRRAWVSGLPSDQPPNSTHILMRHHNRTRSNCPAGASLA
jgi:hypothetical protein